jgi:hypothetical protein
MSITINLNNVQPLDELLTALSDLSFAGNQSLYLRVNSTADGFEFAAASGGGGGVWGSITGTLSAQTDLQNALNLKAALAGAAFTGAVSVATSGSGTTLDLTNSGSGTTLNIANSGSGSLVVVDSTKFVVTNAGNTGIGTASPSARQHIVTGGVSTIGQIIQAAAGQTANLQEWRNSSNQLLAALTPSEGMKVSNTDGTQSASLSFNALNMYTNRFLIQASVGSTSIFPNSGELTFLHSNTGVLNSVFRFGTDGPRPLNSTNSVQDFINVNPAINQSGTAGYRMLKINPTETAIGSGEKYLAWFGRGGSFLSGIDRTGAFQPASLADAAAANNTVYYSTTQSKLVFKDGGGVVNDLY